MRRKSRETRPVRPSCAIMRKAVCGVLSVPTMLQHRAKCSRRCTRSTAGRRRAKAQAGCCEAACKENSSHRDCSKVQSYCSCLMQAASRECLQFCSPLSFGVCYSYLYSTCCFHARDECEEGRGIRRPKASRRHFFFLSQSQRPKGKAGLGGWKATLLWHAGVPVGTSVGAAEAA